MVWKAVQSQSRTYWPSGTQQRPLSPAAHAGTRRAHPSGAGRAALLCCSGDQQGHGAASSGAHPQPALTGQHRVNPPSPDVHEEPLQREGWETALVSLVKQLK